MTYLTIKECAKLKKVTNHAIQLAIKSSKLKAEKVRGRWIIKIDDLYDYEQNKFNRDLSLHEGKLRFDSYAGELSVKKSCKIFNLDEQKFYYALRRHYIPAVKKGGSWVVNITDVENYKRQCKTKKKYIRITHGK